MDFFYIFIALVFGSVVVGLGLFLTQAWWIPQLAHYLPAVSKALGF